MTRTLAILLLGWGMAACGQRPSTPMHAALEPAGPQRAEADPSENPVPVPESQPLAALAPPAAGTLRRAPACSYLSVQEVSDILHGPIGKTAEQETDATSSCGYPPLDMTSYQQAQIDIQWQARGASTFEDTLARTLRGSATGRQVAHTVQLGDTSSYSRDGVMRIHAGEALISITLLMRPDSEAKAVALGTLLLQRMGYAQVAAPSGAAINR